MVVNFAELRFAKWACDRFTEDADFGKKKSSWRLCKQAKLSHLGHRKPAARIHWKDDPPKTSHCLVRIWSRGIIGPFFFENKHEEAVTVNGDRCRAMLNKFLFIKIEEQDIGNICFQQDSTTYHTAEAILDVLRPVFEDRIISRKTDVVWPPRSWDLTPLDYYLWA